MGPPDQTTLERIRLKRARVEGPIACLRLERRRR